MEDIQALIPNVGNDEAHQCGRDHTIRICGEEVPVYGRYETGYAQREREAQRGISLLLRMQQLQCKSSNNNLKVTKSLYIVTHLGQLPFMLFTQMNRTWTIKEDSVNTSIIHWYSIVGGVFVCSGGLSAGAASSYLESVVCSFRGFSFCSMGVGGLVCNTASRSHSYASASKRNII